MAAQISEALIYQGQELDLFTEPLKDYFALDGKNPGFIWFSTANWRGYDGTWEVTGDRLYLVRLMGHFQGFKFTSSLDVVFPGFPDRVFAHWYSGTLRVPQGELLGYVHGGYMSTLERDLLIKIGKGVVVSSRVRHNSKEKNND